MHIEDHIPYSQKIWPGIKFGSLAVCLATAKTAKFKSANIFAMVIWGPTAKFNSRQYFRLYGNPKNSIFFLFKQGNWINLNNIGILCKVITYQMTTSNMDAIKESLQMELEAADYSRDASYELKM